MLATRQVLGNATRSRVVASMASRRTMATVSDSPLEKKVSLTILLPYVVIAEDANISRKMIGQAEQLGRRQLYQLQEDV